jgi:DNA gyrase/topoisomerase IV subunit B
MPKLIDKGHLYLAIPPLYRISQGAKSAYAEVRAGATAERQRQIRDELIGAELVAAGRGHVQDLSPQRQHGLRGAVEEKEVARKSATRKLRLPGKLADCSAAGTVGSEIFIVEGLLAWAGEAASQWSKASRIAVSTMREASTVASLSLVCPWNSGSRMKTESIEAQVAITSSVVTAVMRLARRFAMPSTTGSRPRPPRPTSCSIG